VLPARQSGTAALSVGGSPGVPSSWSPTALADRRRGALRGLSVFVACDRLEKPVDLLLLLFDEGTQAVDRLPGVLGRDVGAVAVVAPRACSGKIRFRPKQVRRLRGRHEMMDACRAAAAARSLVRQTWPSQARTARRSLCQPRLSGARASLSSETVALRANELVGRKPELAGVYATQTNDAAAALLYTKHEIGISGGEREFNRGSAGRLLRINGKE
jgi:hypothetical protein